VRDAEGTALAGIDVTVSSRALLGGTRSAVTNDAGRYRFPALPIGTYTVRALHEGLGPEESIASLRIGSVVTVDFVLHLPTEYAQLVTGVPPLVDGDRTTSGLRLDSAVLQRLPTGRSYQGLARWVAGVNGGANPNVHGETLYSNGYLLDGLNVTDPVTHTFTANLNFDAIESVEIITGAPDAQHGQATGAVVNVVTRSGGNELSADSSVYYSDGTFASGGKEKNGDFRSASYNLNLGGPILANKIWFFASYELDNVETRQDRAVNANTGVTLSRKPRVYQGHLFLGKITWQLNPAHQLTFLAQSDPATISNTGANASLPASNRFPDAYARHEQGGAVYSTSWDWIIGSSTLVRSHVGYSESVFNELPSSGRYDLAGHANAFGDRTVNFQGYSWDRRRRVAAASTITHDVDDRMGSHRLRAGLDSSQDRNDVVEGFNGDAFYFDSGYQTDSNGNIVFDDSGNPVGNVDTNTSSAAGMQRRPKALSSADSSRTTGSRSRT